MLQSQTRRLSDKHAHARVQAAPPTDQDESRRLLPSRLRAIQRKVGQRHVIGVDAHAHAHCAAFQESHLNWRMNVSPLRKEARSLACART